MATRQRHRGHLMMHWIQPLWRPQRRVYRRCHWHCRLLIATRDARASLRGGWSPPCLAMGGGFGRADCRLMLVSHLGLLKTRMGVVRHMQRPRAQRRKRQCSPRPRRRRRGLRAERRRWFGGLWRIMVSRLGCVCVFAPLAVGSDGCARPQPYVWPKQGSCLLWCWRFMMLLRSLLLRSVENTSTQSAADVFAAVFARARGHETLHTKSGNWRYSTCEHAQRGQPSDSEGSVRKLSSLFNRFAHSAGPGVENIVGTVWPHLRGKGARRGLKNRRPGV